MDQGKIRNNQSRSLKCKRFVLYMLTGEKESKSGSLCGARNLTISTRDLTESQLSMVSVISEVDI